MSSFQSRILPGSSAKSENKIPSNNKNTSKTDSSVKSNDKYEIFERWLRENGGQFELLELREYDSPQDEVCTEEVEEIASYGNETSEEKKDSSVVTVVGSHGKKSSKKTQTTVDGEDEEENEMRGVYATTEIKPNTICVSIPKKCLITVEMGQATEIGQAILNSDLELDAPKHVFLMVYLLWDLKINGEQSFFKPYYDILPKTLKNMPIFWSTNELKYLEGSYLLTQIIDRNEAIEEDYKSICEISPQLKEIASLEQFKWARMCVCSRNFGLQIDGNRTSALVPYADMLNHHRPRETKWTFCDDRQAFTITSLQSIYGGSQVYDSYGQKCNHRFLLNYGFAVEDNREVDGFCPNEVPIEASLSPNDPLFLAKYEFWTRGEHHHSTALAAATEAAHFSTHHPQKAQVQIDNNINRQQLQQSPIFQSHTASFDFESGISKRIRVCVSNNENTRILISLLRVIVSNESEFRFILNSSSALVTATNMSNLSRAVFGLTSGVGSLVGSSSSTSSSHHGGSSNNVGGTTPSAVAGLYRTCRDIRCPLSIRNEQAAMQLLLHITTQALSMYPASFDQDIKDLENEDEYPRFSNKRHAKIQVKGEKEVLHHFADFARTALRVLGVIEREIIAYEQELTGGVSRLVNEQNNIDNERSNNTNQQKQQHNNTIDSVNDNNIDFETLIRSLDEDDDYDDDKSGDEILNNNDTTNNNSNSGIPRRKHHTIVRYCADVLGALRREEKRRRSRSFAANHPGSMFMSSGVLSNHHWGDSTATGAASAANINRVSSSQNNNSNSVRRFNNINNNNNNSGNKSGRSY